MGNTPLDVATRQGGHRVMDILRSAGAKVSHYCVPVYLTYAYNMGTIKFIHLSYGSYISLWSNLCMVAQVICQPLLIYLLW